MVKEKIIYSCVHGGLGNQMFQYAIGLSVSLKNKVKFEVDLQKMKNYDLRDFSLNKFNISASVCDENISKKFKSNKYKEFIEMAMNRFGWYFGGKFYEKNEFYYDNSVFFIDKVYFKGYWQSFKYFEQIRNVILEEFSLKNDLSNENSNTLEKIKSKKESVALHIRRGDYISNSKNNKLYNVVGLDYYKKAIEIVNKKIKKPVFFIFSDDIDWVAENLKISGEVFYASSKKINMPEEELILMSKCEHNIIANSTFSWWGAWLNQNPNKNVIAPKRWMSTIEYLDDLYPKNWIRL